MTIICLGDSLTYGYEVPRKYIWTALAEQETGMSVCNKGVNGLLTEGMLALCNQTVLTEDTTAVYLMGGANDILAGMDVQEPERNMARLVAKIRAAGIPPVIGIPIPFCPPIREDWAAMADFPTKIPIYERYVDRLRILAKTLDCATVDFRAALARHTRENAVAPCTLYGDGIHLNKDGHRIFATAFVQSLRELAFIPQ